MFLFAVKTILLALSNVNFFIMFNMKYIYIYIYLQLQGIQEFTYPQKKFSSNHENRYIVSMNLNKYTVLKVRIYCFALYNCLIVLHIP